MSEGPYRVVYSREAQRHLEHWAHSDRRKLAKIAALIEAIKADPFRGMGKPEPLAELVAGTRRWSRRIDQANRLVYRVTGDVITVSQARFHYDDH